MKYTAGLAARERHPHRGYRATRPCRITWPMQDGQAPRGSVLLEAVIWTHLDYPDRSDHSDSHGTPAVEMATEYGPVAENASGSSGRQRILAKGITVATGMRIPAPSGGSTSPEGPARWATGMRGSIPGEASLGPI